jgi:hypothetical protein
MKKIIYFVISLFLLSFIFPPETQASLVSINEKGEVIVNVLASETPNLTIPKSSELQVKNITPEGSGETNSLVSLDKNGDKLALNITSDSGQKSLDVTSLNGSLVEIEERPQVKKINIGVSDGKFIIEQEGIAAITDFPISVNPKTAQLSLFTPSGERFLSVLPKDAFESGVKAKAITKISAGLPLALIEEGGGKLSYQIEAEKSVNFFDLVTVDVPVRASISASTGEIINLDEPAWLRVLGFLFG